jgi:mono/diheme cytochrome c family protein
MPRSIIAVIVVLAALSLVPIVLIARARAVRSEQPRVHLVADMDSQPKFKAQARNPLFADKRAMRLPVEHAVARGELRVDEPFYRGKDRDGQWITVLPVKVTEELMQQGKQRFEVFCATCHGLAGYGDGMIAKRADALQEGTWVPPTSFHTDTIRQREVGYLFNTITYGVRNMAAYGPQVPVADRWAVVAYIRALQRSQNATLEDVPPNVRPALR